MMNNNKKTLIMIISILIIGITIVTSYAYFVASLTGNDSAYDTVITSGEMALMLNDGEQVGLNNAIPGDSVTKEFSVKNTGTVETTYNAYFSELLNQFEDKNDLVYTLTSENGCPNSNETVVPSEVGEQSKFISNCTIKPNQIHNYQLTITFKNDNTNQDDNKGKRFSAKISINEYKEYEYIGYIIHGSLFNSKMKNLAGSLDNITNIQFSEVAPNEEDNFIEISNTDENYASDCPTYMWFDNGTINIYTKNKKLYLHEHSETMFSNMPNLLSIDLSKFDTSKVIGMNSMFANDSSLTALDVSNFNTSKVEDMTAMFSGMTNLEYLILLSFDTSNVKSMTAMFFRDTNLKFVNLYSFDTRNVTSMESMFNSCESMERLDLKNFNTPNVTNMSSMFTCMYNLKDLKLDKFFTTFNVTNMSGMFSAVKSLKSLDISEFNTAHVKNIREMFVGMENIETIYVGYHWDISSLAKTFMFEGNTKLVGGAGTIYNYKNAMSDYARIDDPEHGKPGYFTLKS